MVEEKKNLPIYEELLRDWLCANRREALILGGGALAHLSGMFELAYADAEFQIKVLLQDQMRAEDNAKFNEWSEKTQQRMEEHKNIGDQLGIAYRAPMCGMQNLTTMESRATGTAEQAPRYLSVTPETYFSNDFSRNFLSGPSLIILASCLQTLSTGANFVKSVEWSELLSATVEKATEAIEGELVEKFAKLLIETLVAEVPEGPAKLVSWSVDILKPEIANAPGLTEFDRLSPAERRDFNQWFDTRQRDFNQQPKNWEPLPEGPVLRNAPWWEERASH